MNNTDIVTIKKQQIGTRIKFMGFISFIGKLWLWLVLSLIPLSIYVKFQETHNLIESFKACLDPGMIFIFTLFIIPPLGIIFLCKHAVEQANVTLSKYTINLNK